MMAHILIVAGTIFVVLGVIGLVGIAIQPITKAFGVVFKRKDDYVFYESKEGKSLLEHETKALAIASICFIILGSALAGFGTFLDAAPRGEWSFWKDSKSSTIDNKLGIQADGHYISPDGTYYDYYIIVYGNSIEFSNKLSTKDIDEFKSEIDRIDKKSEIQIYVIDDFAISKTYKDVIKTLNSNGIKYAEKEN